MDSSLQDHLEFLASSRRDLLKLAAVGGGIVMSSALPGCAGMAAPGQSKQAFSFVQLSDIHWGYNNATVNPDFRGTLPRAIAAVNSMESKPDFVVFTGDLTQSTDNPSVRRDRLKEFRDLASELKVPVRYFAGEHDASLDRGEAYQQFFGNTLRYTFDHKGLHFIVLDNTSDPAPILGDAQLDWLKADLAKLNKTQAIVVLTHRPLFALYPQWDWATRDGEQAIALLQPFPNVTVFYGHIHHEHHHMTGHIAHHAASSTMFPLAPVGTTEKKTQLPWNSEKPYAGLGWQAINSTSQGFKLSPFGLHKS
jgi:3',5'-cyclic AMP phosphodiesterase CpdA